MIIVFGASGFLGRYLFNYFSKKYSGVIGTRCGSMDSSFVSYDFKSPNTQILDSHRFQYAIICSGQTSIDDIKKQSGHFEDINLYGVMALLKELNTRNIVPIYLSSDNVFDGLSGNYHEEDLRNPINEYGRQKKEIEDFIINRFSRYIIVRTSKLYCSDEHPRNFLYQTLNSLELNREIPCDTTQIFCPTHVDDICKGIHQLIQKQAYGLYHIVPPGFFTRYELSLKLYDFFGYEQSLIKPVDINQLGLLEKRPLNITMNSGKFVQITRHHFQNIFETAALIHFRTLFKEKETCIESLNRQIEIGNLRFNLMNTWFEKRNAGRWISDYLTENHIQSIGVYGLGTIGERLLEELMFKGTDIPYIVDSRVELQGGRYAGIPVINEYMIERYPQVQHLIVTPFHLISSIQKNIHNILPHLNLIGINQIIEAL